MRSAWLLVFMLACGSSSREAKPEPAKPEASIPEASNGRPSWTIPAGWRSEVIPFPLDFAPTIDHTGEEELRFPKGFFDPASLEYWSYTFLWRTTDAANLDAAALAAELTVYFQGLIAAVDEKKQVKDRDAIVARATANGARFELTAHVFDAFKTGQPIDLVGWAERHPCGSGAIWVFVLAPVQTSIRAQLDELATAAKTTCGRG